MGGAPAMPYALIWRFFVPPRLITALDTLLQLLGANAALRRLQTVTDSADAWLATVRLSETVFFLARVFSIEE